MRYVASDVGRLGRSERERSRWSEQGGSRTTTLSGEGRQDPVVVEHSGRDAGLRAPGQTQELVESRLTAEEVQPYSGARGGNVFISYRRQDAGRLFTDLASEFGEDRIFKDVDNVPLGADVRSHIAAAIGESGIVLVLVGPDWDTSRLHSELDWIRIEVEEAMAAGVTIVPVRVRRAEMPSPDEVPESMRYFCGLNAAEIEHQSWSRDLQPILAVVSENLLDPAERRRRDEAERAAAEAAAEKARKRERKAARKAEEEATLRAAEEKRRNPTSFIGKWRRALDADFSPTARTYWVAVAGTALAYLVSPWVSHALYKRWRKNPEWARAFGYSATISVIWVVTVVILLIVNYQLEN